MTAVTTSDKSSAQVLCVPGNWLLVVGNEGDNAGNELTHERDCEWRRWAIPPPVFLYAPATRPGNSVG
jgi:hypothetical protein